jgi:hypothetical protein
MSDAAVQKERVSAEQVGVVRGVAIAEVLGTDMKKHFDITSRFQVKPTKRFSNRLLQAKLTDPILQTCMTAMQQSLSTQNLGCTRNNVESEIPPGRSATCFHVCCCCVLRSIVPILQLPIHAKRMLLSNSCSSVQHRPLIGRSCVQTATMQMTQVLYFIHRHTQSGQVTWL